MALFMVANNLTPDDVLDPKRELAFPESVVEFFEGRLGQPPGGFPQALQKRVLRGRKPLTRPARRDAAAGRLRRSRAATCEKTARPQRRPTATWSRTCSTRRSSPTSSSTSRSIRTQRPADADVLLRHGAGRGGQRRDRAGQDADHQVPDRRRRRTPTAGGTVFFELNGQPREIAVLDRTAAKEGAARHADDLAHVLHSRRARFLQRPPRSPQSSRRPTSASADSRK